MSMLACCPQATTFVLYESASGFALFEVKEFDEISQAAEKVQEAVRWAMADGCVPGGQGLA